jgi:hypothetical protein
LPFIRFVRLAIAFLIAPLTTGGPVPFLASLPPDRLSHVSREPPYRVSVIRPDAGISPRRNGLPNFANSAKSASDNASGFQP